MRQIWRRIHQKTLMDQMSLPQALPPEGLIPPRSVHGISAQETFKLRPFSCAQPSTTRMGGGWVSGKWRFPLRLKRCNGRKAKQRGRATAEDSCQCLVCSAFWRKSKHLTLPSLPGQCSAICRRKQVSGIQVTPFNSTLSLCIDILTSCTDINKVLWFVCICSAQHVQTVFIIQSRKPPRIKFPKEPLKREEETEEWEL